jgi:type I restriction enzyme M protein
MVELLDPPAGSHILDPACGTGGFLVNTLLHWRRKATAEENLRIEWDGTPHRCFGGNPDIEDKITDACFTGYDNDRTMVRIGWMNLILHGLEFPQIEQRDSLSKHMEKAADKDARYDFILANPPFTGQVDEADLSTLANRFPRAKGKFLTTKSELLFVWLMLDLLKVGGRCAVVVPDGVLFGGTNTHKKLRWELLSLNALEAVISLPGGVFLPYAGVKTSILVFRRDQPQDEKEAGKALAPGSDPRTREVWFYEVSDEAFTLDQKRKERFTGPNDLYDAQAKYTGRDITTAYNQPDYWLERWRAVDADFLRIFPGQDMQKDQVLGIEERFAELPRDPKAAAEQVQKEESKRIRYLLFKACSIPAMEKAKKAGKAEQVKTLEDEYAKLIKKQRSALSRAGKDILDREYEQHGHLALLEAFDREVEPILAVTRDVLQGKHDQVESTITGTEEEVTQALLLSFARLDGYDIWLRSVGTTMAEGKPAKDEDGKDTLAPTQLSWVTPVRAWAKFDDWGGPPEGQKRILRPTHGADGTVLQEYLDYLRDNGAFDKEDGSVKPEYRDRLDPACIEACDFNLAAGRHKPFTFEASKHRPPTELIGELQDIHGKIQQRLGRLLKMVEGAE